MSGIQHEWTLNSVTALEFCRSPEGRLLLLVGEGAYLKVFDVETSKLIAQCQVFNEQIIHGFSIRPVTPMQSGDTLRLVVWGGCAFTLLDSTTVNALLSCDRSSLTDLESAASDWILDAAVSPFPDTQACVLVTAHCALLYVSLWGELRRLQPEPLFPPLRSILYSAHVVWTSPVAGLIAAGMVFGEIEVIAWHLGTEGPELLSRQVLTLAGHEGSVFGVQISPEILGADGCLTRLLASCSDDRTVRVWRVSAELDAANQLSQTVSARETGFQTAQSPSEVETVTKKSIAVAMGHVSRIWKVKFLTHNVGPLKWPTAINILSFGEDATCQQWSLDAYNQDKATLTHINSFSYHSGKHIWSVALLLDNDNDCRLATGGADGKVSLYNIYLWVAPEIMEFRDANMDDISKCSSLSRASINCLTIYNILLSLPTYKNDLDDYSFPIRLRKFETPLQGEGSNSIIGEKNHFKTPKDTLNRYCFLTEDKLLITTSTGSVLLGSIMHPYGWHELKGPSSMLEDLKSYSIMLGIPHRGIAILAGTNGTIYMFQNGSEEIRKIHSARSKVASLFDVPMPDHDSLCVLVISVGSIEAQLLSVKFPFSQNLISNEILTIKLSPRFVVTSACYVNNLLVLGSRKGSLAFYDLTSTNEPLHIFRDEGSGNGDAVTSIINIPPSPACNFLTTSRNGSYSIFSLPTTQNKPEKAIPPTLVHQSVPPPGLMIETAWFDGSDLMLYGFRSKSFAVWNESKQCEVASVECGGAHRNYTYLPVSGADGAGHFVFTKASKLHLHSQGRASHVATKSGGHGREVKACAVLDCGERKLIATGSEDTTIRIWSLNDSQLKLGGPADSFRCHAILGKHTTGIQHLKWCSSQDCEGNVHYLFSAGGAEEFYVWSVSTIPGFGLGVVCVATLNDQSEARDLRIMNFTAFDIVAGGTTSQMLESRFRIMLVYSNSTVKLYEYSRTEGFRKLAEAQYTSHCLTQVATIQRERGQLSLHCTAATDGHLALWEFQELWKSSPEADLQPVRSSYDMTEVPRSAPELTSGLKLLSCARLHQSSILALAIVSLPSAANATPGADYIVATGGDDNALSLALFCRAVLVQQLTVPAAHAAAISGLAFLNCSCGPRDSHPISILTDDSPGGKWCVQRLITVSGDQRIKQWWFDVCYTGSGVHRRDTENTRGGHWRLGTVEEENDAWCSVADAAGLVAFCDSTSPGKCDKGRCLIYGAGMEMFGMTPDYGQRGSNEGAGLLSGFGAD